MRSVQVQESRASSLILRSTQKKQSSLSERDHNLHPFFNYALFACCVAFPSREGRRPASGSLSDVGTGAGAGEASGSGASSSATGGGTGTGTSAIASLGSGSSQFTAKDLLGKLLVPVLRLDQIQDIQKVTNIVLLALGHFNPDALEDLFDELTALLRDSSEKSKQDNVKKRRRREMLKLHLVIVFDLLAKHGVLQASSTHRLQHSLLIKVVCILEGCNLVENSTRPDSK